MSPAALRAISFTALAAFVAFNWVAMVVAPPLVLTALAVGLIATTAAAATAIADRHGFGAPARAAVIVVPTLVAMVAAMMIVGLPARLLLPSGWAELQQGVDVGLAGIGEGVSYPYSGANEWSRLITLIAAPVIVALAASFAFVSRSVPGAARIGGLAVLVVAYVVAATTYDPSVPLLRGALLCLLVAAWLWIPTLRGRRQWALAASLVAVALAVATPLTVAYGDDEGLVDYRSWDWGPGAGSSFDWEHGYGPIDWDRDGETVFIVRSDQPNYWKARVLDRFNGTSWIRSDIDRAPSELPSSLEPGFTGEPNPEWATRVQVTIDELRSDLVIGPGTDRSVISGVEAFPSADRGEVRAAAALSEGDAYEVRGYAPDPTVEQMRAAGSDYGLELAHFSAIDLPGPSGLPIVQVHTIGLGDDVVRAEEQIRRSPYRRTLELAQRIGAGAPSAYDTVKRIEEYLQSNYSYSESPPDRANPLSSFLFEDRIGYCQQFSGAMALMVRMLGIPSRVATGFSPGVSDGSGKQFRVRDLDAHSWVEIYFNGIGWVPFDPTPPEAPAVLQAGGGLTATAAASALGSLLALGPGIGELSAGTPDGGRVDRSAEPGGGSGAAGGNGGGVGAMPLLLTLGLFAGVGVAIAVPATLRRRRAAALAESELCAARVRELRRALDSLGWRIDPDTTLLELEQRLRSRVEPEAAAYLAGIRAVRYQPRSEAPLRLSAAGRRALRRRLSHGRGTAARLRALWLIPLGAPRV